MGTKRTRYFIGSLVVMTFLALAAALSTLEASASGKVYVKPYGHPRSEGYEWDGKVLKPYGAPDSKGWEWNGKVLKPYGAADSKGWEMEGDVPVPAAALVVLDIARRK